MTIDLEKYEYLPTNKLNNFSEALKTLLPNLYTHRCSPGCEGGFYLRLQEGTWLGHVIEHVALELQCLAGMDCGFGRTFSSHADGIYEVIFAYQVEEAGFYAAHAAFNLVSALAQNQDYSHLENDIKTLANLFQEKKLGPSTQAIVNEAQRRHIPYSVDENYSLITLGYGSRQKKLWATMSSHTSALGVDIALDKALTKKILASYFIPVPTGYIISSVEELDDVLQKIDFPLVIKPFNGNHGRGVTTNITSKERLISAYKIAAKISEKIIIEQFFSGHDYRILMVDYKVVAVARRTPAMIVGTGLHTIKDLIMLTNQDPDRGEGHEKNLTTIKIDEITTNILNNQHVTVDDILPKNQVLYLKDTANLSAGGTAADVTDEIHPANVMLAERVARLIGLDICGIDVIANNINSPIDEHHGAVLEINAGPGLRMHLSPSGGKPRNVARPIIDMLFPHGEAATIPIIAVTGTNGKTTVVRLIANMLKKAGQFVGFTTTDGIYLDNMLIHEGDCSGPQSAKTVLREPQVDIAVLECARGGILREGLGFDTCDISVITNITSDHLGLNDIHTLDELARVKAVVAHSTKKTGFAILNAENDLTFNLKKDLDCHVALFGSVKNDRILHHCQAGGLAAYVENNFIIIQKGADYHKIASIMDIPLTYKGTASAMIQNILPAVLVGFINHFSTQGIAEFLHQFHPTIDNLPGRMNLFNFPHCKIMLDYAHNEGAFIELTRFLNTSHYEKMIGIIGVAGDRREEDIIKIGYLCAHLFDEIIIRHDQDGRGRTNQQLTDLLIAGINQADHDPKVHVISHEMHALDYAIKHAPDNTFIFCAVEAVFRTISYLKNLEENALPLKASIL